MSDRAETEKSFNLLQEEYHKESLPQVIENWEQEQKPISTMNNFYCGLHL